MWQPLIGSILTISELLRSSGFNVPLFVGKKESLVKLLQPKVYLLYAKYLQGYNDRKAEMNALNDIVYDSDGLFESEDDDGFDDEEGEGEAGAPNNGGQTVCMSPEEVRRREIIAWCDTNLLVYTGKVARVRHVVMYPMAAIKTQRGGKWKVILMFKSLKNGYGPTFGGPAFMGKLTILCNSVAAPPNSRLNGPSRAEFFNLMAQHIIEVSDIREEGGRFNYAEFFDTHNMTHAAEARLRAETGDNLAV